MERSFSLLRTFLGIPFKSVFQPSVIAVRDKTMGKNKDKGNRGKASDQKSQKAAEMSDSPSPVTRDKSGNVLIKIIAKPGAKENRITDITSEGVGVQIAAPPVDGEANTELLKFLASSLGLRKSDVALDRGSRSRQKTITVSGSSLENVDKVLCSLCES
ncbi:hypothetical protein SK128_021881 [Halocaridina rubra]|uniref:Uncharacterized protein n=1 Tax=Halocaridina rubra TaxID=373956 RepID=A0AAN8XHY9_HALRR